MEVFEREECGRKARREGAGDRCNGELVLVWRWECWERRRRGWRWRQGVVWMDEKTWRREEFRLRSQL
jgi:hypothetical protein